MGDELVELLEGAGVEQQLDALARRQLAGLALPAQPLLAAAELGAPVEIGEIDRRVIDITALRPSPPAPSPSP